MLPVILKLMKQGGYRVAVSGFTVVEVLIVLAVSGILLISAMTLINGRQSRTEFMTGINDTKQQLEQIINETKSGYYPDSSNFQCTGAAGPNTPVSLSVGANAQGTNYGCMFVGKAIQVGLGGGGAPRSRLGVLSLVGNQYDGGAPVTTIPESVPRAAYPLANAFTTANLEYGMGVAASNNACLPLVVSMCYVPEGGGGPTQTGMLAIVTGDSTGQIATTGGSGLSSGGQQFSLYGVTSPSGPLSAPNQSLTAATNAIGNLVSAQNGGLGGLVSAKAVFVCIASSSTKQSGLFTIGGDDSLSVNLQIKNGTKC